MAAVFEPNRKITIFIDGKEAAPDIKGNLVPARRGSLTIGRSNLPQTWNEFQLTTENTYFHLDGLLDEIRITGRAKSEEEIRDGYEAVPAPPTPALSRRDRLPTGPVGSGSFGAFHTRLNYYKE